MCDVFPAPMAFAMQGCMQYRTRLLDNGSARRLNELFEARVRKREKRQIALVKDLVSKIWKSWDRQRKILLRSCKVKLHL